MVDVNGGFEHYKGVDVTMSSSYSTAFTTAGMNHTNIAPAPVSQANNTTEPQIIILTDGPAFEAMHKVLMRVNTWPLVMIMIFSVLGTIGNSIVLYIYLFKWKKSKTRVFILCLGWLDLMNCMFNMPVEIAVLWMPIEFDLHYLCKLSRGCTFIINNTGSMVFVSIAIERYLAVYYPLKSRQLTPKFAKGMCLLSFLIASGVSWPSFVFYGSHTMTIPIKESIYIKGKTCLISDEHEIRTGLILIFTTILFGLLIVTFVVLTTLYIAIGRKIYMATCTEIGQEKENTAKLLSRSIISALTGVTKSIENERKVERKPSRSSSERSFRRSGSCEKAVELETAQINNNSSSMSSFVTRAIGKGGTPRESRRFSSINSHATRKNTVMMRVVTIAFMLSFTPFLCILVIRYTNPQYYLGLDEAQKILYQVFIRTYFINSMVNPFIYGFMNDRFRRLVKEMLMSVFCSECCKKKKPVYQRNNSVVTFMDQSDNMDV